MALSLPRLLSAAKTEIRPGSTPPSEVYVFLHGLMLLQFKERKLVVTAPRVPREGDIPGHEYSCMSLRPGEMVEKPKLTAIEQNETKSIASLVGGEITQFPGTVLQFSASATMVGAVLDNGYWFRLNLPLPKQIITLRESDITGKIFQLKGTVGQKVKEHIQGHQNKFSLVTCLKYGNNGGEYEKYHFYAEPPDCAGAGDAKEHTNHALRSAKSVFMNRDKFDLEIEQIENFCVPPITSGPIIKGSDSYHLCEVLNGPISCSPHSDSTGGPLCSTIGVTTP
jgi:hypothetical protein